MLVYDEQLPPLDDKFEGDEVNLLAVRGGKVDRHFRRNYAWAKHAADAGRVKKIAVVVAIDRTDWVHTVGAVTSALSGGRLHVAAEFRVHVENLGYSGTAAKVQEALQELAPPVKFGAFLSQKALKPLVKPQVKRAAEAEPEKEKKEEGDS